MDIRRHLPYRVVLALSTLKKACQRSWLSRVWLSRRTFMGGLGQDFWVYGEAFNGARGGFFLDIGAHDGIELSNTFLLERRFGWKGICIEANPTTFRLLKRNRRALCLNLCLDAQEGVVDFAPRETLGGIVAGDTDNQLASTSDTIQLPTTTLTRALAIAAAPHEMDYLSLDVEGAEDRVLLNFDFAKYRFNCMTIERPSAKLVCLLQEQQYTQIRNLPGFDGFFVHESFVNQYKRNLLAFYSRNLRWHPLCHP